MTDEHLQDTRDALTFRSKVDTWLALLMLASTGALWFSSAHRLWVGRPTDVLDVLIPLLTTAFMLWLLTTTSYEVTSDRLIIRSGPVRRTVPLASVQRLRATHNPAAAPALSLDRIEVTYGARQVLVSPRDKRGFVNAIVARAPAVVVDGVSW